MLRGQPGSGPTIEALRKFALGLPGAEESVACAGTAIEKRTVKSGGKAFLFLGSKDLMLKLGPSLAKARELAAADPERCRAGAGGWVNIRFATGMPLPAARLRQWVAESHALLAGGRARPKPKGKARRSRLAG
jgi:hypothetical protein